MFFKRKLILFSAKYNLKMNSNDYNPLSGSQEEEEKSNYFNGQNNNTYYKNNFNPNITGTNFYQNKTVINEGNNNQFPKAGNNRPNSSINWKNVMRVDLNVIRNTNDLSLLNSYLENLLYSSITEDDVQAIPEEHILKLIKILQFCLEYFLVTRQNLNYNIENTEQAKEKLNIELQKLEEELTNQTNYLDKLKAEKKERVKDIANARNAVDALVKNGVPDFMSGNTNITDINVDITKKYSQTQGRFGGNMNGYKCMYCLGITFPSQYELKRHLNDIHLIKQFPDDEYYFNRTRIQPKIQPINVTLPPMNNANNINNNDLFERKLIEMKMNYQETLNKERLEMLRNQLSKKNEVSNEGPDYKLQLERMGNIFNDTLRSLADMIPKNQEKQKIILQPKKPNYENDQKIDEEINNLKMQIENAKKIREAKRKEYEEKLIYLKNDINQLINEKTEIIEEINKKKINLPKKEIYVAEQKEPIIIRKNNIKKRGKRGKFHSGLLESDHDDSDRKRKEKEEALTRLKEQSDFFNMVTKKTVLTDQINLRGENKNIDIDEEDLDHFYERYIARDKKYLKDPKFKRYLKEVLSDKYIRNNVVSNTAKNDINDKLNFVARFFYDEQKMKILPECDVNNLKKESKKDLLNLVDIIFKDLDILKNDDSQKKVKEYYNSVQQLLDFNDIKETIKNDINYSNNNILNELANNYIPNSEEIKNINNSLKLENEPQMEDGKYNFDSNQNQQISNTQPIEVELELNQQSQTLNKYNLQNPNNNYKPNNTYYDNQMGNFNSQTSNIGQNQNISNSNQYNTQSINNFPNTNNNAPNTNYSSAKMGQFNITNISNQGEGQNQQNTFSNQNNNFPNINNAPNTTYSSIRLGPYTNTNNQNQNLEEGQNQQNNQNPPYSSGIEGKGETRPQINTHNKKISESIILDEQ